MRHSSDASVCCKSSDYRYCSLSNSKRECRVFTNERWMRISNGSWSLSFHQIFLNKCLWKCTHSVKQPWDGHGISNEWWRLNTSIYSSDFCGSLFHKVGFSIKFIIFGGFVGFNCIMFALQPLLDNKITLKWWRIHLNLTLLNRQRPSNSQTFVVNFRPNTMQTENHVT